MKRTYDLITGLGADLIILKAAFFRMDEIYFRTIPHQSLVSKAIC